MNDPIVAEVRRLRDAHAKQFGYDIERICADYRQKHEHYVALLRDSEQQERVEEAALPASDARQ